MTGSSGLLRLSASRLRFGRNRGRAPAFHDYQYFPNNHLTSKGVIEVQQDDWRSPYRPKPGQRLRGSGLHSAEKTMLFRLILWNRIKGLQPQRTVPPLSELREDWHYTVGFIWLFWGFMIFYVPQKAIHLATEQTPWLPAKTDGSRRPKQRSPMLWWAL